MGARSEVKPSFTSDLGMLSHSWTLTTSKAFKMRILDKKWTYFMVDLWSQDGAQ